MKSVHAIMVEGHENININCTFKKLLILLLLKLVSEAVVLGESNVKHTPSPLHSNDEISTNTEYYYDDYYNQYDPLEVFKTGSDNCTDKSSCSEQLYQTFPDKLCHCDKLCGLMNDCCGNYGYTSTPPFTKDQFDCVSLYELVKNRDYGVTMVTKCSPIWEHNFTKALCEDETETDDIFQRLPVSDKTEFQVMFKNMYCAQCNFVIDFVYWKQEIKCQDETGSRHLTEMQDCVVYYIRPQPNVTHRTCQISQSIVSVCNQTDQMATEEVVRFCSIGQYNIVYDEIGNMYRNKYCALCNGVFEESMFCEQMIDIYVSTLPFPPPDSRTTYSLRLIVDFNTGTVSNNEKEEKIRRCKDNQMYDGLSQKCREIFCAPPLIPTNGVCNSTVPNLVVGLEGEYYPIFYQKNCTMTKIDSSDYQLTNSSEVFIFSHQKVYSTDQIHWNGSDVFICLSEIQNCSHNCKSTGFVFYADGVESYLTLAGFVVSILSLAITLVVYIAFPQLLNTPGKILVSLISSLILAQILFISAAEVEHIPEVCIIVGVLVHYFFLSAFCWMNVIAFDLWMTFSNRFMTPFSDRKGGKRFTWYSLYAWLVPIAIVCPAVILDFVNFDATFHSLKPKYGKGVCWISSRDALILFFAGPLAVFKIFDIISFISTAIHIARAKKQGAMATRKKNTCSFIVNLKLSLIMGLTWVFAFVANATNETSMWYLFIIFNSLQGLFIAICFLCTKKVGRLVTDKFEQVSTKYTTSTQVTSVT